MFDEIESVAQESRESRSSENTSVFGEAYEMLGQQSFKNQDSTQASSQNAIDLEFGTLDLFDSTQDIREPSFKREGSGREGAPQTVGGMLKESWDAAPEQISRQIKEIGDAWSNPGAVIDDAVENGRRILSGF
jgi:hypothetical protein